MIDYLMLIVFPSKTLDKLHDKKPRFLTLYLIFTITILILTLPKYLVTPLNSPNGILILTGYLISIPITFFLVTYTLGYFYWIVAKGFKGVSSFVEMRILVAYSFLPFFLQAVLSIPFITAGLIKHDAGIITHDNYLTYLILWLLSFRILMVGMAKYNKFNWMITLFTWLIATTIIGGLAYLLILLKK